MVIKYCPICYTDLTKEVHEGEHKRCPNCNALVTTQEIRCLDCHRLFANTLSYKDHLPCASKVSVKEFIPCLIR
jgi:hypothetical protein